MNFSTPSKRKRPPFTPITPIMSQSPTDSIILDSNSTSAYRERKRMKSEVKGKTTIGWQALNRFGAPVARGWKAIFWRNKKDQVAKITPSNTSSPSSQSLYEFDSSISTEQQIFTTMNEHAPKSNKSISRNVGVVGIGRQLIGSDSVRGLRNVSGLRNASSNGSIGGYMKKKPFGADQHKMKNLRRRDDHMELLQEKAAEIKLENPKGSTGKEEDQSFSSYRDVVAKSQEAFTPSASFNSSLVRRGSSKKKNLTPTQTLNQAIKIAQEINNSSPRYTKQFQAFDKLRLDEIAKDEQVTPSTPISARRRWPASLSVENLEIVKKVWKTPTFIATLPGAQVEHKDILKLKGLQWLNDEVITYFSVLINTRSNKEDERLKLLGYDPDGKPLTGDGEIIGREGDLLKTWCFTSFFFTKLSSGGYSGVKRWTKRVDIFTKDIVVVPINHGNSHWVCAAINLKKKRFEYYDSLGTASERVYIKLREYLEAEHLEKKKSVLNLDDWVNYWDDDVPQQENQSDCGVFTVQFMESLSRSDVESFDFDQRNMIYLRYKMVLEIKEGRLMDEAMEL